MTVINLFVQPNVTPLTPSEFAKKAPKYSISLDGYVKGKSYFDAKRMIQNFNHHEGCVRSATLSTCAQVRDAIRDGLFEAFRNEKGQIELNIFVNDCDEDVCVSVFLLMHAYMAENVINPKLNKLVHCEDALDRSSGAYPFPKDMPMLRELAYIFEPYRQARRLGLLATKDPALYKSIIEDVGNRIMQYISGNGKMIDLDTNYEIIGGGNGWSMVNEIGEYARIGMYSDKIKAFVSVKERGDGVWDYVIGKRSMYIRFNVEGLFKHLNQVEGLKGDIWGGGDLIGGSPRVSGSKLSPKEIETIVNNYIGQMLTA